MATGIHAKAISLLAAAAYSGDALAASVNAVNVLLTPGEKDRLRRWAMQTGSAGLRRAGADIDVSMTSAPAASRRKKSGSGAARGTRGHSSGNPIQLYRVRPKSVDAVRTGMKADAQPHIESHLAGVSRGQIITLGPNSVGILLETLFDRLGHTNSAAADAVISSKITEIAAAGDLSALPVDRIASKVIDGGFTEPSANLVFDVVAQAPREVVLDGFTVTFRDQQTTLREQQTPPAAGALQEIASRVRASAGGRALDEDARTGTGSGGQPPGPLGQLLTASKPTVSEPPGRATTSLRKPGERRWPVHPELRIDNHRGDERPNVVVIETEFDAIIGIAPFEDPTTSKTGTLSVPVRGCELEILLHVDADSLVGSSSASYRLTVPPRSQLTSKPAEEWPSVTVPLRARALPFPQNEIATTRRIGACYLLDGAVIGWVWREIRAVARKEHIGSVEEPAKRAPALLNLTALLDDRPPDAIVAVTKADDGQCLWTAYSALAGVPVPDGGRKSTIGGDTAEFASQQRRFIEFGNKNSEAVFGEFLGHANKLGRSIPDSINKFLDALIARGTANGAPTVLLLTEDPYVPWELAHIREKPEPDNRAPWLGAHVAIGRWSVAQPSATPELHTRLTVQRTAVVTANYTDVAGGGSRLENAEHEAALIAETYRPSDFCDPDYDTVRNLFRGTPPAEVIHLALHGKYSLDRYADGLVLVEADADQKRKAVYLSSNQLDDGRQFKTRPLIFLNACQVGVQGEVLGAYSGFATVLLAKGASGVIAPMWNIDDDMASATARNFYAAAYHDPGDPVPVAEYLRRLRASYTEASARTQKFPRYVNVRPKGGSGVTFPHITPTLIAYQFWGHPRLTLDRNPNL